MNYSHLHYQIALTLLNGIGPIKAKELIEHFDNIEEFFTAKPNYLHQSLNYNDSFIRKLNRENALKKSQSVVENLKKLKLNTCFITDNEYPHRLKNCVDAPVLFYRKGDVDLNPPKAIAIVGTRNATSYGKEICEELIKSFQGENVIIVSGLAYGIDATVHKCCLKYEIPTVGVLGHGLDRVYPSAHKDLAHKMANTGGLISEFIPGTLPDRENFPKRNRIVAGMTDATIVIESKKRGGSLITANLANDYNRDVFAYPGSVHMETSQGCNHLIANQKAHLIQNSDDFHKMMGWTKKANKKAIQHQLFTEMTEPQKGIVELITTNKNIQIDVLSIMSKIPISKLNQELFTLEMDGIIKSLPGKQFSIA